MKHKYPRFIKNLLSILIVAFIPNNLIAKECNKKLCITFKTDFFNNYNYDSNTNPDGYNENYFRSNINLEGKITKNLYLKSKISLKEVNKDKITDGKDSFLENQAIDIKKINLNYKVKNIVIGAGKFTANFGNSQNKENNIWLFNEARNNYRQDNKIGIISIVESGDIKKYGLYKFYFSSFFNDNKYVDGSIITKKENDSKNVGNPGDKRGLGHSYIGSLDINFKFSEEEKLSYHFSYINLAVNKRQSPVALDLIDNQYGYVINMDYSYPLNNNISANTFIEYVNFNSLNGNKNSDIDYFTSTLSLNILKKYSITLGRFLSKKETINTNGIDHNIYEFNIGYNFNKNSLLENFKILTGLKMETIDYKTSKEKNNILGLRLNYKYRF